MLAVASLATSAFAHLAEVTTSVELGDVEDGGQLKEAVPAAIEDVLHDAIAFTPTVVELTGAQVVRERLHLRLLVADEDGEETMRDLRAGQHEDDGSLPSPGQAPPNSNG